MAKESANKPTHDRLLWCMSSLCSRSCCSLCRPLAISDAKEDSFAWQSVRVCAVWSPKNTHSKSQTMAVPRGAVDRRALSSVSLCCGNCIGSSSCSDLCKGQLRVPIKSIKIPQNCINPRVSAEMEQKAAFDLFISFL